MRTRIVYFVHHSVNRRSIYRREVSHDFRCDNKEDYFDTVKAARAYARQEAACGLENTTDEALRNEYRGHLAEIDHMFARSFQLIKLDEESPYRGSHNGYGEWE